MQALEKKELGLTLGFRQNRV